MRVTSYSVTVQVASDSHVGIGIVETSYTGYRASGPVLIEMDWVPLRHIEDGLSRALSTVARRARAEAEAFAASQDRLPEGGPRPPRGTTGGA